MSQGQTRLSARPSSREAKAYSPIKQLQFEFWTEVRKSLEESGHFQSLGSPRPQYWFEIALGRADVKLSLTADTDGKRVGIRVYLRERIADEALRRLLPQREEIEREVSDALEWNPRPQNRDKVIVLTRDGDISNRTVWPELVQWLTAKAVAFHKTFGPRIMTLPYGPTTSGSEDM